MEVKRAEKVVIVGSGLGGISAAISLAQEGFQVQMYEKNDRIGGKLNFLTEKGYTFDLGPSILTLPHLFEDLFSRSGRKLSDYVSIRTLRPHWRNFFEDGTVIDLLPEPEAMALEAEKAGEDPAAVRGFLKYSGELYDLVDSGYFQQGLDDSRDFRKFYGLLQFPKFDLFRSMHGSVCRHLKSPYMRNIFDFFIKYVGSSALRAPAFMNCLPTIQFRYDLWYADGGMYNIARGLGRLMEELGIEVNLRSEVTTIGSSGDRVTHLELENGRKVEADIVVSNMEVIPAYRRLLNEDEPFMRKLRKFEPACSGLVLDLGLDRKYPQLAHHNFFFSGDQHDHFTSVFQKRVLPRDPTIYLVAASRTDPTVAPEGCDCLKILPHIPYIREDAPISRAEYMEFKELILDKLERMGLEDLRKSVVFEHVWTPEDILQNYYSNKGSIYGVVSDRFRNFAFKAPKRSTRYGNLYFVGGSVNPGGGMPMVVLSGRNAARMISEDHPV
ncbi:MAG: phytoene desaturase [Candidatus Fermentibacteraceae bacterium]|nr:phytoene desaturase [Candidatus Fermentibacteraceae bacterium]MBN2607894.1 phytoene desaturase [Candidatus Fermentibacteraceae bacterium]